MLSKAFLSVLLALGAAGVVGSLAGCRPATPAAQPPPLSEFERDLQYVARAGVTRIFVVARKDGQAFEPADSKFLKANAPEDVSTMYVVTDGGRRVIVGTNTEFKPDKLAALNERFNLEDRTTGR